MREKLICTNDFHNTEAKAYPVDRKLSKRQVRRLERELCGMGDWDVRLRQALLLFVPVS